MRLLKMIYVKLDIKEQREIDKKTFEMDFSE